MKRPHLSNSCKSHELRTGGVCINASAQFTRCSRAVHSSDVDVRSPELTHF